jgi:hypothetical protein
MSTEAELVSAHAPQDVASYRPTFVAAVIGLGFLVWLSIVLFYVHVGFSVYREDLKHYIDWSYDLSQHSDYASHMPGWPALIWFARTLSFGQIEDTVLAQVLAFLAWSAGVVFSSRLLAQLAPKVFKPALICFAFFLLIGVSTAANPFCDVIAYTFALGALLLAFNRKWWALAATISAGLLIHQAFYAYYLALAIVCVLVYGMPWLCAIASGIPFILYYAHVAVQKHDINWIAHFHEKVHTPGAGKFPFLEGIIGTALRLTPKDEVKAVLLAVAFAAGVALSIYCIRARKWLLLTLCVPVVLAGLLSPENVAFVILRLSKGLVFPAAVWATSHPRLSRIVSRTPILLVGLVVLILSQAVWAYYSMIFYGFK